MKSIKNFLAVASLSFMSFFVNSAPLDVEISTGDLKNSYATFIGQASTLCSNDSYKYTAIVSDGSPQNLDRLLSNDVPGGIAQLDVGDVYRNTKDVSNLRVLLPLFPEQVHFLTRAGFSRKEVKSVGGVNLKIGNWTPGSEDKELKDVSELAGLKVAAVGGSAYTAQMLMHPNVGNLVLDLQQPNETNTQVLAGLVSGKYDAVIMVSAAPAGVLTKDLQPKLRLVPMSDALYGKITKFYPNRDSLSYREMGPNGTNIPTFQVMSALLVPNYTKGPFVGAFSHLRDCILKNAEDMASTPKTHIAWRYIASGKGKVSGDWKVWEEPAGVPNTNKAAAKTGKK